MATKKTTTKKSTTKKATKPSAEKKQPIKEQTSIREDKASINAYVWVFIFAILGIIIYLSIIVSVVSYMTGETALLGYLTGPFMGMWGMGTPVIGVYLLSYSYFCYKYQNDSAVRSAKGVLMILNIIFLLGIMHLISTFWCDIPTGIKSFWDNGLEWRGCGIIGGLFGTFLSWLLHKSVGLIVGIITYGICLAFYCGISPIQLIKMIKRKINHLVRYMSAKSSQQYDDDDEDEKEDKTPKTYTSLPVKDTKKEKLQKKASEKTSEPIVSAFNKHTEKNINSDFEGLPSSEEKPMNNDNVCVANDKAEDSLKTEENKNPSLYVPESIYDAPFKTVTPRIPDERTDIPKDTITMEEGEAEPVKNKFGFRYGREAKDENGNLISEPDTAFDIDNENSDNDAPPFDVDDEDGSAFDDDINIEEANDAEREALTITEEEPVYVFPPVELLERGMEETTFNASEVEQKKRILLATLEAFKVKADVVNISCGPTITRYEIEPEMGVSVKSIEKLGKDLALRLAAKSLRIEAPIPGKCAVGIEVSNNDRLTVKLRDILDSPVFRDNKSKLFCCLGVDVAGNAVYLDIAKMPHLLIAGATGMGKSVCLNCLIISLLYRATPQDVRLILIDPKKVEFSHYADLPHLLAPVVTNINKCAGTLNWAVAEMERRYDIFEANSLRNLQEYQAKTADDPEAEKLASIVIVIDELADLMMQAGAEVENSICRLAQKARAAGMYLILGTQRPSVDVITGLIKANIPSRVSLAVTSQVDSRTILDTAGAENLLDKGDILFAPAGARKALRVQGAFVSTKELNSICDFVRQNSSSKYDENVIARINEEAEQCGRTKKGKSSSDSTEKPDTDTKDMELMIAALEVGFDQGTISTSYIQRRLSFGYAKAARVVDLLQQHGFVSAPDPVNKLRKITLSPQEFAELKLNHTGGNVNNGGEE